MVNRIKIQNSTVLLEKVDVKGNVEMGVPHEILRDTDLSELFVIKGVELGDDDNYVTVLREFLSEYKDYVIIYESSVDPNQQMKDVLYATLANMTNISSFYPDNSRFYFISSCGVSNKAMTRISVNNAGIYLYEALKDAKLMDIICGHITGQEVDFEACTKLQDVLCDLKVSDSMQTVESFK